MTDTLEHSDPVESSAGTDHTDDHGDHPTEKGYWQLFALLAAITALEVIWSYLGFEGPALVVPLVVMMVVKFVLVAAGFMHLKYDLALVNGRVFTVLFVFGLTLAIVVYAAMIASFAFQI